MSEEDGRAGLFSKELRYLDMLFYDILFVVMKMKKILLIGSTVCDMILYLDHLPVTQEDVHPEKQITRIGGCAFNAAHVVAHLGVPYEFVSPIGTGVYGEFVRNEIKHHGVNTSVFVQEENGSCMCFVEKGGERTFLSVHGAEYGFKKEWLDELDLADVNYGYLCGLEVEDRDGQHLIDAVKTLNIKFLFAPGPRLMHIPLERMNQLFELGVMLHLNDDEALRFTKKKSVEDAAVCLYEKTRNEVIITCGSKGCLLYDGHHHWVPSEPVKVKDTIGAGDSHAGAVLAALSCRKSMIEALRFANVVAGKVVQTSASVLDECEFEHLKSYLK